MSNDSMRVEHLRTQLAPLVAYSNFMVSRNGSGIPETLSGSSGKNNDPRTWCTLDEALSVCVNGTRPGFVFTRDCPYVGLDFDAARSPETGEYALWALPIVDMAIAAGCHVEVSKSGTGFHIVGTHPHKAKLWPQKAKHLIKISGEKPMIVNGKEKHPQIEVFFGHAGPAEVGGNYLVLTGDIEAEGNMKESLEPVLDLAMNLYGEHREAKPQSDATGSQSPGAVQRADVESALEYISPDCDYNQWISILMALHSAGEPWVFDVADSWSSGGSTYKPGEVAKKWKSFRPEGGVSIATLFKAAKDNGWRPSRFTAEGPPDWTTEPENQTADKQSFSDPLPLSREETAPEPYPVHALGEVLGEAAQSIHRIAKLPVAIAAQSVLSAANLMTQGLANVAIDGRTIPLSLFLLAIALSGERKSEADRIAMCPVDVWQKRRYAQYREQLEEYEEKLANWKKGKPQPRPPMPPMVKCEEPTIQGIYKLLSEGLGFVGILSDEGGQLLGGYAMSKDHALETVSRLSKLWDGKPLDRIRGTDVLTLLYDRRANLHLMLQPGIADKLLCHDEAKSQGFLNRCLICHPPSMFGNRPYQALDPGKDPAIGRYWECMTALINKGVDHIEGGGLMFQTLELTPEAKREWIRFHDVIDGHIATGGVLRPIAGAAAKGAEQSLRIAGTLALFDGLDEIGLEHMKRGIELTDFYLSEMLRLHEGASVAKEITEAQKLLDWIRQRTKEQQRNVVYLREMYQFGPCSLRTAKAAKPVVAELVNHGYLIPHDPVEIDGSNRKEVWLLWEGKQ